MEDRRVSRRLFLLAASTTALSGCGIRWESDAPAFLPDPPPDPAGPPVVAERARVDHVLRLLESGTTPVALELAEVHRTHLAALDAVLGRLDPPVPVPPGASVPPTAAVTPAGLLTRVATAEAAGLDATGRARWDDLVPRAAEAVVASVTQRSVATEVLRRARVAGVPPLPAAPWTAADERLAAYLAEAVRATVYGLEVAAAHTAPAGRAPLLTGMRLLSAAEAGFAPDASAPTLGYALPHRVRDAASAGRLVQTVLSRLVDSAVGAAVPTASALSDRSATAPPGDANVSPTGAATGAATAGTSTRPSTGTGAMAALVRLATLAETVRLHAGGALRPLPVLTRLTSDEDGTDGPTPRG